MEFLIIPIAAFIASGLTLFSGFGLGTLLMPVFAIFFPVNIAIAMTAVVHLFNNLFKLTLLGKYADRSAIFKFGLPAILSALLGAWALLSLSALEPLFSYHLSGRQFQVMPVKVVVAVLLVFFSIFELTPRFENISFEKRYLPLGGILSGFFGGLSGHQGALRSAFLMKCGLSKQGFLGTGVMIACLVDITRISIYSAHFSATGIEENHLLLTSTIVSAFLGAFIGNRLVKKITMRTIQVIVSVMLFGIAVGLGSGII
ncbi:MAG TPA: hypothetical protein DEP99_04265 [Nitrospiraceae bacterium]|nr:hypothetical protein [Nitrospiraceae bacterium]